MPTKQAQIYCKQCGRKTLHAKEVQSAGLGCLLGLLTCGILWVVWIIGDIFNAGKGYRCQVCGKSQSLLG